MLEEFDVFGLDVKTFGLFFALNFVAWGAIVSVRLRELGKPADWAWEMVFVALAGGFLGARLYWILDNWDEVDGDVLGNVFSGSGLTWYGGLAGGALAMVVWARWRGFLGMQLLDIAAFGLPIGYAIGRIGCQISGDGDYGKAVGRPVGDAVSRRRRCRRPTTCTRRRSTRRSRWAPSGSCCGTCATACAPAGCSRSTSRSRGPSASSSSSCAATRRPSPGSPPRR